MAIDVNGPIDQGDRRARQLARVVRGLVGARRGNHRERRWAGGTAAGLTPPGPPGGGALWSGLVLQVVAQSPGFATSSPAAAGMKRPLPLRDVETA